jgi:general secretion pathway protein K
MLALWALFLLSAMIVSWVLDIHSQLTLSGNANRMLEAEALACSGAEIATHPSVTAGSSNLQRKIDDRKSFEARITGEGGRLNLNWLLAGEDPNRVDILKRYLDNKGIELNDRDAMIDALLDWVEPDTGLHRLNAPPETDDYHPRHAPLTRIENLKQVSGWADFTSRPNWDDDFTLNSSGPVDLAWASRDVLLALPGMTPDLVDRFLFIRRGPDGIDGTADDAPFQSIEDVRAALGFSQQQFEQLAPLVTFRDPVLRIVSVGRSSEVRRVVQMVIRRADNVNIPQLITWKEF